MATSRRSTSRAARRAASSRRGASSPPCAASPSPSSPRWTWCAIRWSRASSMPTTRRRPKNSVTVQYAVPRRGVPAAAALARWARAASPKRPLTLRVVGAREGRLLNRQFRRRDRATNVLSFAYGGEGDIVLCHPVVAREARSQGKSVRAHYAHLVVHGVLHLRGYVHDDARRAQRMEAREIRILRRLGFADPYTVE